MFKREFEWGEDEEYGWWGWIPKGFPEFNAGKGMLVAHDVLEHFTDDSGTLEAEIRALGAMVFIRGEGGYFWNKGSIHGPGKNLGADLAKFYDELSDGMHSCYDEFSMPPRTCRLDTEGDYIIEEALEEAKKLFRLEQEYNRNDNPIDLKEPKEWERKMRGWLRIGYRKAVKRYCKAEPYACSELFRHIEMAVDNIYADFSQGDILTIKVNPKMLTFKALITYPYDY